MIIQHNMPALNAHRQLLGNNTALNKSLEKLSSGFRINRAGDDAAGLAISEKMRAQIRGLEQAGRNAQDGISLIQTGEGALQETQSMLQRMRELAVQSANGTYQNAVDRDALQKEVDALKGEIDRVSTATAYNGIKLLDGKGQKEGIEPTGALGAGVQVGTIANDEKIAKTGMMDVTITRNANDKTWDYEIFVNGQKVDSGKAGKVAGASVLASDSNVFSFGSGNKLTYTVSPAAGAATNANSFKISGLKASIATSGEVNLLAAAKQTATAVTSGVTFQIGANGVRDQRVTLMTGRMDCAGLGIDKVNVDVSTREKANAAIDIIDSALNIVSQNRADFGALQNRLEHTINNLGATAENLTASESRIRDADMAKEMMNFTKSNILTQAAQAMLAQANTLPQGVLQLLQ